MDTIEKFNALPWHDSALLNIEIDRKTPGKNDSIKILLKWPDNTENLMIFNDCYFFEAKMNFGVLAEESILSAVCSAEGSELDAIQSKWASVGIELDHLFFFKVNTNTTNSYLSVCALSFDIK